MIGIKNIVLGSKSPRRKELLQSIVSDFEIVTREVKEIVLPTIQPKNAAKYLAELKASVFQNEIDEGKIVITSDTVVLNENLILGKPKNSKEAFKMLSSLSGKAHKVITGVCISSQEDKFVFDETTKVVFKTLSKEEIEYYIRIYKPFDKAGAYGIQEWIGMIGIERIEGCFYNVMGLPTNKLYEKLKVLRNREGSIL